MEKPTRRARSFNLNWDSKSTTQKRHHLYHFMTLSRFAFWKFCGKDKTNEYKSIPISDDNVDEIRDLIFKGYVMGINDSPIYEKEKRISKAREFLYGKENN